MELGELHPSLSILWVELESLEVQIIRFEGLLLVVCCAALVKGELRDCRVMLARERKLALGLSVARPVEKGDAELVVKESKPFTVFGVSSFLSRRVWSRYNAKVIHNSFTDLVLISCNRPGSSKGNSVAL